MTYDLTSAMSLAWARYKRDYAPLFTKVSKRAFATCLRTVHAELRFAAYYAANPRTITNHERKLISVGSNQRLTAAQGGWNDAR